MAAIKVRKIAAATIIETMVAMTILLVLFGMAITLLVQVTLAGNSGKKIKAEQLLSDWAVKTKQDQQYVDEEITADGFLLKRTVKAAAGENGLLEIEYSIYEDGKKLLPDRKELVIYEEAK